MNDDQYTMQDYLNAFRRRAKIFFGIFVLVFGIAIAAAILPPDVYRATAEMRIDLEGPNIDLLEPVVLTNYADQYVKSLEQKVMTNDNLRKWLEQSNAYVRGRGDSTQTELIQRLQEDIRIQMVFTSVIDERSGKEVDLITGFTTSFIGNDPAGAEVIANEVAAAFLAEDKATRVARAAAASSFLTEQIDARHADIVEIEAKIATFKEQNTGKLPDLMVLNMNSLERSERELETVQREIRSLQQDRFFREAQLEDIRQSLGGAGAQLAKLETEYHRAIALYGPDHPDVMRIRRQVEALTSGASGNAGPSQLAQLQAELAAAQERYSDQHPDVVRLKRRIQELQTTDPFSGDSSTNNPLYLQLQAQINAIDSNLQGFRTREQELRRNLQELQDKIAGMPQVERQYQDLQRQLATATLAYDGLRKRLTQAEQTESYESGERGARLVQVRSAEKPQYPSGPPRFPIAIIGIFLAASLAGAAAFVAEISDDSIRGSKDVQIVLRTPPIATIPVVQNSVSLAHRRHQLIVLSLSALTLATIMILITVVIKM